MNLEMQRILDAGNSSGWPYFVLYVVDEMKQPFDVVAYRMTVGDIAHTLTFIELKNARERFQSEQANGR